jgi:hypothetical protein
MFKEVMNDLWLARISSLSNEVGLYVVLLEVLFIHLKKILSAVKEGQQKYCETVYSRSGINHMWILKISKDLLDNLKSRSFSQVSSIKTFDFSTLYTTLPHDKLKNRLKETIHKAFSHRNYGSKFVVLGYNSTYFSNKIQKVKYATPRNK